MLGPFSTAFVGCIVVFGMQGNDIIVIDPSLAIPTTLRADLLSGDKRN